MTAKRVGIAFVLLLIGCSVFAIGLHRHRVAKARAFCQSVADLPRGDLAAFASRCSRLMSEKNGAPDVQEAITNSNVLREFELVGEFPQIVYVSSRHICLHYLRPWRYDAMIWWGEEYSESGDGSLAWELRAVSGDRIGPVIYLLEKRDGEQIGPADGSQPFRPETNRASGAAGSRR